EIHTFNGRFYIYFSSDTGGTGNERVHVLESQGISAFGPYSDRGVLFTNYWNIDGSVFTNALGQLWFVCSARPGSVQNLYIAPMSNPYTLSAPLSLLSQPTQSWERNGTVNEGPYGILHNGRLFIVYSASGCWTDDYCLGLLEFTGLNMLDPASWTKTGPVFSQQPGAYGPGHDCVIQDSAGQWWNIYHANELPGQGCDGDRQIRAQRVYWRPDGEPDFGTPVPLDSLETDGTNFLSVDFPLTESGGANAVTIGCGKPGTLVGSPIWMKPGLKFNGAGDYLDAGAEAGNDVQHNLTLAAWIRADAFADWAGIITKGTNASPYAMQMWHDGSLRFTANWGSPAGSVGTGSWNSAVKMKTNQWYHAAITYDGATIRFYINATLDSYQPAAALRFGVVNEPLVLGADFPGGDEYFAGTIRDARVYGRALSAAEIRSISGFDRPPTFVTPAPNRTVGAGQSLALTNTATEPASPPQTITYSLLSGPGDAAVDSASGLFRWRPGVGRAPSTNPVSIRATDDGSPAQSATQNFLVTITNLTAPRFGTVSLANGTLQVSVSGDSGPDYVLESATALTPPISWTPILTNSAPVPPFTWSVPAPSTDSTRFYRLELGP
ncbi:MAG TPA: family 43 glycosylhydrolase, partial [Verrucomicrobiae bacterium]|nr:family 43 glycosylhydrolase [Verrucomicrobiae bacterium]